MKLRTKADAVNDILRMSRLDKFTVLDESSYEEAAQEFVRDKNAVIAKLIDAQRGIAQLESDLCALKKQKYELEYYDLLNIDAQAIEDTLA